MFKPSNTSENQPLCSVLLLEIPSAFSVFLTEPWLRPCGQQELSEERTQTRRGDRGVPLVVPLASCVSESFLLGDGTSPPACPGITRMHARGERGQNARLRLLGLPRSTDRGPTFICLCHCYPQIWLCMARKQSICSKYLTSLKGPGIFPQVYNFPSNWIYVCSRKTWSVHDVALGFQSQTQDKSDRKTPESLIQVHASGSKQRWTPSVWKGHNLGCS